VSYLERQSNDKYNQQYHRKYIVQISTVKRYPIVTLICYVTVRRYSKCFTRIIQRSRDGINSVPKYKYLHFVNLSEQTATSLCSKESKSATKTENMRFLSCLSRWRCSPTRKIPSHSLGFSENTHSDTPPHR
jgi:hypothetical protein